MARSKRHGITRQHAEYADDIITWLKVTGGSPLEIGVMEELKERLTMHAKNGAIVRVRLKNRGNPRGSKGMRYPTPMRMNEGQWVGGGVLWSVEEMDMLSRFSREEKTADEMHEMLPHRTPAAIRHQLAKMGMRARTERVAAKDEMRTRDGRSVLARAREVRARRIEQERRERSAS